MNLEELCRRVLEALVNGGYQGLVLTGLVLTVLWRMRAWSAATRHNVCLATLLLVALLPAAHLARAVAKFSWFADGGNGGAGGEASGMGMANEQKPNTKYQRISNFQREAIRGEWGVASSEAFTRDATQSVNEERNQSAETASTVEGGIESFGLSAAIENPAFVATSSLEAAEWNMAISFSDEACVAIAGIVGAIGLMRLGVLGWQLWCLGVLKRKALQVTEELEEGFRGLCEKMHLRRAPALLITERDGPWAVGFWKPAVIVPRRLLADGRGNANAILRHELAHLDRGDDWASLFQQAVQAVFFFHPAVWVLSRRLSIEREIACDDHVLAARPNRRDYALLLTEFAGQAGASRFAAAPAAWGRKTELRRRIDMILNKNRNASPRASRMSVGVIGAAAGLVALLGIGFAPQIAMAQSADETATADAGEEAEESAPASPTQISVELVGPETPRTPRALNARKAQVGLVGPAAPAVVPYIAADLDAPAPVKPVAPRKPRAAGVAREDQSLERRLDRLEKMIEELVAREKGGFGGSFPGGRGNFGAFGGGFGDPKEMARVQKEIERAHKDMERAAKEMKGAHQSFGYAHNFHFDGKNLKANRKALEAHRKALEKELERLNEQISELEQEEESLEESEDEKKKDKSDKEGKKDADESEENDFAPKSKR